MKTIKLALASLLAVSLIGCESEPQENLQLSLNNTETTPETEGALSPFARFDPSGGVLPFPNDILFRGTTDGTLNIPAPTGGSLTPPQVALNALDGFSTIAPITAQFSVAIDPASISSNSVKLFRVTQNNQGVVTGVLGEMVLDTHFEVKVSPVDAKLLTINPKMPLAEKTSYMAVVTNSLKSTGGKSFGPSTTLSLIKAVPDLAPVAQCSSATDPSCPLPGALQLLPAADYAGFDQLRIVINAAEKAAADFSTSDSVTTSSIVLSWVFKTQSIGDVLEQLRTTIVANAAPATILVDTGSDSPVAAAADIFAGAIQVPYYQTAPASANDPGFLEKFWMGAGGALLNPTNPPASITPVSTSTQTIPVLASVPKAGGPAYPVVIYQHGITTNRATMLAVADAFAAAGMAVIAIDLPLHGITGANPLTAPLKVTVANNGFGERNFELDLVTQDANGSVTAQTPDGNIDSSGRHFINLANLLNTRDNVRQAISDLMVLRHLLSGMSAGAKSFDSNNVYFLGHSLGAMVGTTFLAMEPAAAVKDAVLAMGGGGIAKLLDGSASFGPEIAAGLGALGVSKGSVDFESFMGVAQSVVDTADPVNHAADAATGRGILFFEVVGDATAQPALPSDLVVPNRVPDNNDATGTVPAPLSGTEPLLGLLGLTQVNATSAGANLLHSVKFTAGSHGSLLDPGSNALSGRVTQEMQSEAAAFLSSDGALVNVSDAGVLAAP